MDKYLIQGKNYIKYMDSENQIEYRYDINIKETVDSLHFEVIDYKTNSVDYFVNKVNLLFLVGRLVFKLNRDRRIYAVEGYEKIKKNLLAKLYLIEIRNPELKEILEYIEKEIEEEENFLNFIMEVEFMEFLFGGNLQNKKIKKYFGIDNKKRVEVDVLQKIYGNVKKVEYRINRVALNKLLLNYRINNEKAPEYYLEGDGEIIHENLKLKSANLYMKSGKNEEFKREIEIKVSKRMEE